MAQHSYIGNQLKSFSNFLVSSSYCSLFLSPAIGRPITQGGTKERFLMKLDSSCFLLKLMLVCSWCLLNKHWSNRTEILGLNLRNYRLSMMIFLIYRVFVYIYDLGDYKYCTIGRDQCLYSEKFHGYSYRGEVEVLS